MLEIKPENTTKNALIESIKIQLEVEEEYEIFEYLLKLGFPEETAQRLINEAIGVREG